MQFKQWWIRLAISALIVILFVPQVLASAESRLPAIEAELSNLRMRLGRLESQQFSGRPISPPAPGSRRAPQPMDSQDPMFDRLATLVIELREDVKNLEKRVAALEKSPQRP